MTRTWPLVVLVLLACQRDGGGAPVAPHLPGEGPAPAETAATPTTTPTATPQPPKKASVSEACAAMIAHRADGCGWAVRFPPDFAEPAVCERSLETWVAPGAANAAGQQALLNCWALDCEAAESCMVRAKSQQSPPPKRVCGDEGTGAIAVDAEAWAKRRGVAVSRFSEANTSVAEPIEVCGIEGEVAWMMRATCNDGSQPYRSPSSVNDGRDSWIARGGTCNSVLDRYSVKCPEATYTIHIDRYVCRADSAK